MYCNIKSLWNIDYPAQLVWWGFSTHVAILGEITGPTFCFGRLILVNNSRWSSKHCLCLHHRIGLLLTWYGVFIIPKDNSTINASWVYDTSFPFNSNLKINNYALANKSLKWIYPHGKTRVLPVISPNSE